MKRAAILIVSGVMLFFRCGKNQDLKLADQLAKEGNYKKAIELYTNVVTDHQDDKNADDARLALARIHYKQKNYDSALKSLEGISEKRKSVPEVTDILTKCQAERLLLEGIKSAAVEFRQHYVKEREVKHLDINYSSPVFSGPADSLFTQVEVKKPPVEDLGKYQVAVTLTDDPLEPTKIKIDFPDGITKEITLNY